MTSGAAAVAGCSAGPADRLPRIEGVLPAPDASNRALRGLIVDWGGVLTTSLRPSIEAWADEDGIDYLHYEQVLREWLGDSYGDEAEHNPIIALERGEIEVPHFEQQLAQRLRTREGGVVNGAGMLERMFSRFQHDTDMAGVVRAAKHHGLRTALLSNSWGNSYPREGWDEMFDAIVISGEVGMRKPEQRVFRYTAGQLGLQPEDCVFVDDLEINVQAAVQAGLVGVHHQSYGDTVVALEELFDVRLRDA
jgi:putative hydrolase of the HAD superfamily